MMKTKQRESDLPELGSPAQRALAAAGIQRLAQLAKLSETEVKQLHGIGPNALGRLRDALVLKGLSFAKAGEGGELTKKKMASPVSRIDKVNEFMDELEHPFKKEIQIVRDIIKSVNKNILEEIKWKAPSFSYRGEYLVTFNLWTKGHIHLVFHNPLISKVKSKLLEGNYTDRRMAYFADMKDIKAKRSALKKTLKDLIKLQEKKED